MHRTESKVVTVTPAEENTRIRQMEMFGWNLQGRQDVVTPLHAYSYATPDISDEGYGYEYEVDTNVESDHYVTLHFVRSLELPNLEQLRRLEAEYPFHLPVEPPVTDDPFFSGLSVALIILAVVIFLMFANEDLEETISWMVLLFFLAWICRGIGKGCGGGKEKDEWWERREKLLKVRREIELQARILLGEEREVVEKELREIEEKKIEDIMRIRGVSEEIAKQLRRNGRYMRLLAKVRGEIKLQPGEEMEVIEEALRVIEKNANTRS